MFSTVGRARESSADGSSGSSTHALRIAKALIPLIGSYVMLIVFFAALHGSRESLFTLNIRQMLGFVVLGGLTMIILGTPQAIGLLQRRNIHLLSIFGAVAFGLVSISIPYLLSSAGISFPRFAPLGQYQPYALGEPALWIAIPLMGVYVIAEELYFRGLMYRTLRNPLGVITAIAASSIIFAVAHMVTNPVYIFVLLAAGVFSAVTYEYTGTLILGITAHFTANMGVILLSSASLLEYREIILKFVVFFSIAVCIVAVARNVMNRTSLHTRGTDADA